MVNRYGSPVTLPVHDPGIGEIKNRGDHDGQPKQCRLVGFFAKDIAKILDTASDTEGDYIELTFLFAGWLFFSFLVHWIRRDFRLVLARRGGLANKNGGSTGNRRILPILSNLSRAAAPRGNEARKTEREDAEGAGFCNPYDTARIEQIDAYAVLTVQRTNDRVAGVVCAFETDRCRVLRVVPRGIAHRNVPTSPLPSVALPILSTEPMSNAVSKINSSSKTPTSVVIVKPNRAGTRGVS